MPQFLAALVGAFEGQGLTGIISAFQHIESIDKNVLAAFSNNPASKNAAIDALCGILQNMKVAIPAAAPVSTTPTQAV